MAKALDFNQNAMSESFANEILKKTIEKKLRHRENSCILYTGRTKKTGFGMIDARFPGMD